MRKITRLLFIIVFVAAGWWLLSHLQVVPSLGNLFKEQPVRIDSSAVWLKEIRSLAQLITVSAYDEIVVDSTLFPVSEKKIPPFMARIIAPVNEAFGRRLVLIGKVISHSGINMLELREDAIQSVEDSVSIQLPPAQVLDTIINPSGVEVFIEKGTWNEVAVTQLKLKMKRIAAINVRTRGLLQQSERKAEEVLTGFFRAAGFNKITILYNRNSTLVKR